MSEYTATADSRYLALRRAAELIASADPFLTADQMQERLKRAIFSGEFDATDSPSRMSGLEFLRIAVVIPECENTQAQQALKTRVKRFYEMNRDSIASVIFCEGGLPGDQCLLDQWLYDGERKKEVFNHLTTTPLPDFPEIGRRMIADIRISWARIADWLAIHDYPVPSILKERDKAPAAVDRSAAAERPVSIVRKKEQGRPELPGWRIVREHIVKSYDADPEKPFKILAYEARQEALKHCDKRDVPSENTILRRMKEILNN